MRELEIARKFAQLNETERACEAYTLALGRGTDPAETMEAAVYILQAGGDHRIAYTCFRDLYDRGIFREDTLAIMTGAFYEPNVKALKKRYEKNCKLLSKYPYLFRRDFLPFEQLPVRFYPYDDTGYVPFYPAEERFGDYINFKDPIVSRNFFKDLDKPILADDVYSQYELEYLRDNVRDSERVGRENHVYLHYTSWETFCAYLQCLTLRPLLETKKFVFLIEEEIEQYPIDFKERFGIDYSQYPPQPIGVREVNRLIWHTQLSAHNGGDFFNEVFDSHPDLLSNSSILMEDMEDVVHRARQALEESGSEEEFFQRVNWDARTVSEIYHMRDVTDKDLLVALYLNFSVATFGTDQNARVAPAIFFQPHFFNIVYTLKTDGKGRAVLQSDTADRIHACKFLQQFPYIKTFTPMRRITNSYAATVRHMLVMMKYAEKAEAEDPTKEKTIISDALIEHVTNRSFMIDPEDRLYKDSVLVRFEDGKLNPKATFTALAAFLDLPYTESMTYCSSGSERDPHPETKGFDPVSVYRTYDEYANEAERYFIEYFMRDVYENYGYDLHYYKGEPVDEKKVGELLHSFTTIDRYIREGWKKIADSAVISQDEQPVSPETEALVREQIMEDHLQEIHDNRLKVAKILMKGLRFVNKRGQPLRMMPMLKLDPALLEQPLYH